MNSFDITCGHCRRSITCVPCVFCGWRGIRAAVRRWFR